MAVRTGGGGGGGGGTVVVVVGGTVVVVVGGVVVVATAEAAAISRDAFSAGAEVHAAAVSSGAMASTTRWRI